MSRISRGDIWVTAVRERHDIIVTVRDIGLALARRIVVLHGGTIEARSPGPGRSSESEVHLPRLRPNALESAASDRESASPATPPKG